MSVTLLRDPAARFVAATAAVGSAADWLVFAVLVVTVHRATAGSAWATSLVLLAKIVPAVVFAPLAARRADRVTLKATLVAHEALRVAGIAAVLSAAAAGLPAVAVGGLVVVEYAAAVLGAARESFISRHVPPPLFPRLNTLTAVLSYGLLPVGALAVELSGSGPAAAAAVTGYLVLVGAYLTLPEQPSPGVANGGAPIAGGRQRLHGPLRRAVVAAGLGLVPIVMLFDVGPELASVWLDDPAATGRLTVLALAGGAAGLWAANRGAEAETGLAAAVAGLVLAAGDAWVAGLVLVGFGAGVAYLGLQTRLQHLAHDPSQFATAFAVLKTCAAAGVVAAPAAVETVGVGATLHGAAGVAAAALVVAVGPRWPLQRLLKLTARLALRVQVEGTPVAGAAVVVSNHPHILDGFVAKVADESLRPVARWQRHPLARLVIWIGDCVVTTARTDRGHRPAYAEALAHLRAGGRVWIAPEGGAHPGRELLPPRSGAVRMAAAAGVAVQALGIVHHPHPGPRLSDWRPWRRPTVILRWGRTVRPTGDVAADCAAMMVAIADASGLRWTPIRPAAAASPAPVRPSPARVPATVGAR